MWLHKWAVTVSCSALSSPTCATREPANKVPTISVSIWQDLLRNEFSTSKNVSRCIKMYRSDIRLAKRQTKGTLHHTIWPEVHPTQLAQWCLDLGRPASVVAWRCLKNHPFRRRLWWKLRPWPRAPWKAISISFASLKTWKRTIVIIDRNIHRNQEMCTCPLLYCSFNLAWQRKNFPGCASTVCSSSFVSCLKLSCLKPSPVAHPALSAWGCRGWPLPAGLEKLGCFCWKQP